MRLYTLPDGTKVPSVTSILDVVNKPALNAWRARVGNAKADQISRESAEFGTRVHVACEWIANGEFTYTATGELGLDDDLRPFADAFHTWLRDGQEVIATERTVKHSRLRYAGTLDLLVKLADGRTATVDLKTGKQVSEVTPLQLEAYRRAGHESGLPLADTRLVLHLPRDRPGHLEVIEYNDHDRDWQAFLACLALWWRFRASEVAN